jgi:hypothetical protein
MFFLSIGLGKAVWIFAGLSLALDRMSNRGPSGRPSEPAYRAPRMAANGSTSLKAGPSTPISRSRGRIPRSG